jgi:hypothetical protein
MIQGGRFARWRLSGVVLVLVLAAGCGGSSGTTTLPTALTTPTTTETFSGTIAATAGAVHPFTVAQAGTVTLTLTSLSPQTTITMGLGIGQPSTTAACSLLSTNEASRVGTTISGTINPGSYCVAIYDLGNVQGSVDYVLTVVHP